MDVWRVWRRRSVQRGAAAVEFAILLPVMLLVIGGIVDFGRAFFTEIQLTNAAREGARGAVASSLTESEIEARAEASAPGIPADDLTVSVVSTCDSAEDAEIAANAAFAWILLQPAMSLFGATDFLPSQLSSTAVMKCNG